jgi:hypothetical protein
MMFTILEIILGTILLLIIGGSIGSSIAFKEAEKEYNDLK